MHETTSCTDYFRLAEQLRKIDPAAYAVETEIPAPPDSPPPMKARDRLRHTRTLAEPASVVEAGDAALVRQLIQTVRDLVQALGQRPRVIVKDVTRDADGRMVQITERTKATLADPEPWPTPAGSPS